MDNPFLIFRAAKALRWILIGFGCLALIAVCIHAYTAFREWKLRTLVKKGETAMRAAHYAEASLSVRRALQLEPRDLSAQKLMAALMETVGNPAAVTLRGEIVHASGESSDSLIAYAGAALRFGRYPLARSIIVRVAGPERRRPDFQAIAGALALESGNLREAERRYAEAVRIDPGNRLYRIQMATVQSMAEDYFVRKKGRQSLAELSHDSESAVAALRALATSLLQTGERMEAEQITTKLVQLPGCNLADRITHLTLLRESGSAEFQVQFDAIEAEAKANISKAPAVLFWMSSNGLAREALDWAGSNLSEFSRLPEVLPALATCYATLEDWHGLEEISQNKNWAQFDYLRHVYLSRALRAQGDAHLASGEWSLALSAAGPSAEALTNLWNLAEGWQWDSEEEEVLWLVVDKHPEIELAFKKLSSKYLKEENTPGLLKLAACRLRAEPGNEDVQNDVAYLSLLLGKDVDSATRVAKLLHKRQPENPSYASTLALALETSGQTGEASQVLAALPVASLQEPAIAAVYGRVLAERSRPDEARPFLQIARSSSLLPEERELAEKAVLNAPTDPPVSH